VIRIVHSAEPTALMAARTRGLSAALTAYDANGAPSAELSSRLIGYAISGIKETLYLDQHKKCAWCERRRDYSSSPIEHFRPKDGAWRHLPGEKPRRASPGHYWWLTWTWENLLFACSRCNDAGHKANYFPLAAGSPECAPIPRPCGVTVPPAAFDVSGEQPMLLDPRVDSFLDHVRWVPSNTGHARRLWTWSPKALTDRGQATIDILKLGELADEIEQYLVRHVLSGVEEVEQHVKGRRSKQAAASWNKLLDLLQPDESFTAATWCALEYWVDAGKRASWTLTHPPRPT
jgi:hypothetical protein